MLRWASLQQIGVEGSTPRCWWLVWGVWGREVLKYGGSVEGGFGTRDPLALWDLVQFADFMEIPVSM